METFRHTVKKFELDPTRVYMAEVSQGGVGAWGLASDKKYGNLFDVLAPVSGGITNSDMSQAAKYGIFMERAALSFLLN